MCDYDLLFKISYPTHATETHSMPTMRLKTKQL